MNRGTRWLLVFSAATTFACSADPTSPLALGSVQLVAGDGQSGTPGLALADTLTVKVIDQTGHSPMSGVPVQWSIQYGGGSLDRTVDTTDVNGIARAVWTLGATPGTNQVTASVADLPGVEFSATARGFQAVQVSAGASHTCALDGSGHAWCWGYDWAGQLGDSDSAAGNGFRKVYVPQPVIGGHTFMQIAAGSAHTCALDTSGAAWCWGHGTLGELGDGAATSSVTPVAVAGGHQFTSIADGGESTTCALTSDGTAYCWGRNSGGIAGVGDTSLMIPSPAAVAGGHHFTSIMPNGTHSCGVATDSTAWCWGSDADDLLGDSGTSGGVSVAPIAVSGGHHFTVLVTGDLQDCGIAEGGAWLCWGLNLSSVPVAERALDGMTDVNLGEFLGAALLGRSARTWYTLGTPTDPGAPVLLHGLSATEAHACGLGADGTVYCWGANDSGQLGNPDQFGYDDAYSSPHAVVAPPGS